MTIDKFVAAVYGLVINHRWQELRDFLDQCKLLLSRPQAVLTLGKPEDKPSA